MFGLVSEQSRGLSRTPSGPSACGYLYELLADLPFEIGAVEVTQFRNHDVPARPGVINAGCDDARPQIKVF